MKQLTKTERVQILNDNFYILNKFLTKENQCETFSLVMFSGNTNTYYDFKQTIFYTDIDHMNNELEIIDYLKK
jgi:hypothetical protein